jgi:hypothetical protein
MSRTIPTTIVPAAILHKLQLVRQRKLWVHIASAMVAAITVLLAAMGVAMLIDWLATLYDSRWRVVLTLAALSAAAITIVGWLFYVRGRLLSLHRIAGDVDSQIPQLEQRWTTMTRLGDDAADPAIVHPAMLRRVAKEAVRWEPNVEPDQVVSVTTLKRSLIGLTAISAVLGLAVVLNSHQAIVLMKRFWQPTAAISATELVNLPGNLVVGRGEALTLTASVQGTPVDHANLFLQTPEAIAREIDLIAQGKDTIEFSHRLQSVEEPFAYRFRAGDGQTEWYSVNVAERPEIEKLKLTITPPAYTRRAAASFENLPPRLSALQGSQLELAIRPKAVVDTVELRFTSGNVEQLKPDKDGWYRWTTKLFDSIALSPLLTESHGLTNRRPPKCDISVYPDQPPMVKIVSPEDQTAVRPDDTLEITFSASDDTGIGSAELVVYNDAAGNDAPPIATTPIPLGDQQGARSIQEKVDLNLKELMVKHGSELSYEIRVREDRGTSAPAVAPPASTVAGNGSTGSAPTSAPGPSPSQLAMNEATPSAAANGSESSTTNQQTVASPAASEQPPMDGASPLTEANPKLSTPDVELAANSSAKNPSTSSGEGAEKNPKANAAGDAQSVSPEAAPASTQLAGNGELPARDAASDRQALNAELPAVNDKPGDPANEPTTPKPGEPSTVASTTANPAAGEKPQDKTPPDMPGRQLTEGNTPPDDKSQNGIAHNGNPQSGAQQRSPSSKTYPANATASNDNRNESKSASGKSPPSNAVAANMPEKNSAEKNASASQPMTTGDPPARDATSGRQMLTKDKPAGNDQLTNSKPTSPQSSQADQSPVKTDGDKPQQPGSPSSNNPAKEPGQTAANASGQQSPGNSTTAKSQAEQDSPGNPSPGDSMTKRSLDVDSQTSSSNRMRLKIDEFAGSFSGQQRAKLELAIAPELEALDKALAKGQQSSQGVLDALKKDAQWRETHDLGVTNAERFTVDAQGVIDRLQAQSKDTPYAFIGLQVTDIGLAHVVPARSDFWKALQSDGSERPTSVRDGWQHLGRARQLVAELRGQYERTRREFQLAESMEKVKKMYRVYLEDVQSILPIMEEDPDRYARKLAEFKLDDEYLKRLQKVLEMRRDLEAELARILSEDPRLLRRFMDALRHRSENLREELAKLTEGQNDLNREVRAWAMVEETERPRIAQLLMMRQAQDASKFAKGIGELQSRYQAWLPLERQSKDADLAAATRTIQETANAARELETAAERYVSAAQQPTPAPAPTTPEAAPPTTAEAAATAVAPVDELLTGGQQLYEQLAKLQVTLGQMASRTDQPAISSFAAKRLVETERLVADTSAWVRQMRAHQAGNYAGAAEVDQYRLAMKTDALAGKLGSLEQMLAAELQRADGTLPEPIANKAREFIATLDKEVSPNQLGAVYALHSNQLPRTLERQKTAGDALDKAERLYDEFMKLTIAELDKLPVQDPVADLLDDPTLDEILAQLEQELPLAELLGIPNRPSNLQIIGDWLRPGKGNGGGGGRLRMALSQINQEQQQAQQRLQRAYQRALARALKETTPKNKIVVPKPGKLSDWNRLVSQLGDDLSQGRDKAPPEQYRRAIEQYFAEISKIESESKKQSP